MDKIINKKTLRHVCHEKNQYRNETIGEFLSESNQFILKEE